MRKPFSKDGSLRDQLGVSKDGSLRDQLGVSKDGSLRENYAVGFPQGFLGGTSCAVSSKPLPCPRGLAVSSKPPPCFRGLVLFLSIVMTGAVGSADVGKKVNVDLTELRSIQKKIQNYEDLTLTFEQTVFKQLRKRTTKNNGTATFKKPHFFRWSFAEPEQEEWIFDGQSLLHYFPQKGYADRYKAEAAKGRSLRELVDMVLNFDKLLQKYDVAQATKEGQRVTLLLAPKEKGDIEKVELTLDLAARYLTSITMFFSGGNHSTFSFSNPLYVLIKSDRFSLPSSIKISDAL